MLVIIYRLDVCSYVPINASRFQHSQGMDIQEVMGPLAWKKFTFPLEKVSTNMKLVAVVLLVAGTILPVVKLTGLEAGRIDTI